MGNIPIKMQQANRWTGVTLKDDPNHPGEAHKRKKIPLDITRGVNAKTNDSRTWTNFKSARNWYYTQYQPGKHIPLGFMTGDGWCFLDVDNIGHETIGAYQAGIANHITELRKLTKNTYCEISQSGDGLHFIFKVDFPVTNDYRHKTEKPDKYGAKYELYHEARFVALTGNVLNSEQQTVATLNQNEWKALLASTVGNAVVHHTNTEFIKTNKVTADQPLSKEAIDVLHEIIHSTNEYDQDNVDNLLLHFNSDRYGQTDDTPGANSHSSGDARLCQMLAFYTHGNAELMNEIFVHSACMRPKWYRPDGAATYGNRTISKAIEYRKNRIEAKNEKLQSLYNFDVIG